MHHMVHLHYDHKDRPRTNYTFSAGNICEVRAGTGKMSLVRCGDLIIRDDGALLLSCGTADAKCRVEDTFEWGGKTLVATGRALALSALGETQYKVECLERI
jgi:hypothetical protein